MNTPATKLYPKNQHRPAVEPAKPISRAEAQKRLYENRTEGTGSLDLSTSNYYDRRDNAFVFRNDTENLALSRLERQQVTAFAKKHGITPYDLDQALNILRNHDENPMSAEQIEEHRPRRFETLRLESGSTEAAQKKLHAYVRLTTELAQEVPALAERANKTGAGESAKLISILSKYGEEEQAK